MKREVEKLNLVKTYLINCAQFIIYRNSINERFEEEEKNKPKAIIVNMKEFKTEATFYLNLKFNQKS